MNEIKNKKKLKDIKKILIILIREFKNSFIIFIILKKFFCVKLQKLLDQKLNLLKINNQNILYLKNSKLWV